MKKLSISILITFMMFSSCKENNEIKNTETIKNEVLEIDELFTVKEKISKHEQLNFIKDFYALTVVDTMLMKDKSLDRIALTRAIKELVKDFGFSGTEIDNNKLNEALKNSKTKYELANAIYDNDIEKSLASDGLITYDIEKLTDNIFKIYRKDRASMGGSDLLFKYSDEDFSRIDEDMLKKLVAPSLNLVSKKLNRKFYRQSAKFDTYTSTTIEGEKYFTIPYYENYNDEGGAGYQFNLLIAYNGNKFYYLYDDPRTDSDNWIFEEDGSKVGFVEFGATGVPLNPKWTLIK